MTFLNILPIGISLVAITLSGILGYLTVVDRRQASLLSREAELHNWVQKLSALYCDLRTKTGDARRRAVTELSQQIDYGRLFFPNDENEEEKKWNPKGRRSSILDPLVETSRRAMADNFDDSSFAADWREFIDQMRKRTSAFQINTSPEASGSKKYENL